jgi:hypothetical protein
MITFTKLGQYGRLGNQLYQYAALKSAALKHGYECKIPNPQKMNWHGQNCLLENFNLETEYLTEQDYKSIQHTLYVDEPLSGQYLNCFQDLKDNTDICGFFQNTQYFEDFSNQIIKELTPKKDLINRGLKTLNKFKRSKNIVSLHIRRGDQTDGTNPMYNAFYGTNPFDTSSVVGKLITQGLSYFQDCDILVFTGGSRTGDDTQDIQWAKTYFSDKKFIVSQTNDPVQDFVLMTLCDHNIITGPSSFSWWASYINPNPNKVVVAPIDYHFDGKFNLREGFYPKSWKLI